MSYVYIRSEPGLYTAGHYDPTGKWHAESDHELSRDAAARVIELNGGIKRGLVDDLAEALAGWIGCAALNGHYVPDDLLKWARGELAGKKRTPVEATLAALIGRLP